MSETETLKAELIERIEAAETEAALEEIRIAELGKKGRISDLLKGLGKMSPDERREAGPRLNGLRDAVQTAISARREALADAAIEARLKAETVDVTLPVRSSPASRGRIHPISQVIEEITAIFADMGFSIAEGPDIETDYYNFTALNFPEGHPAREMHDTFFLQPDAAGERKVLRTRHLARPDPDDGDADPADPHSHSRQDLSPGFGRHPFAYVPSGRRVGGR